MGDEWTRLALSEAQLPEESLALANAQLHCPVTPQPLSQRLTIPKISGHATGPRRLPQNHSNMLKLGLREPCRPPGSFSFVQSTLSIGGHLASGGAVNFSGDVAALIAARKTKMERSRRAGRRARRLSVRRI